jgi:putative toxin-antitoxin system antitoxin component (TIGR02293 family)
MSEIDIEKLVQEGVVAYQATPMSEIRLVEMARNGISKSALIRIAEIGSLSIKELSELLPVSLRTIQRYKDDDLLDPSVSEHALQIAEVLSKGSRVFNDIESLQQWLHTPAVALGNKTPLSFLDTGFGARIVTDLLGRIEHGVYS